MTSMPRLTAVFAFVTVGLLSPSPSPAQSRRAPTLDDMLDLVQVSSPQISPAGDRVLYTRSELKVWKDNKRVSSIWIADADGSNAYQFLGSDSDRSPQWSTDGSLVAFLSSRDAPGGGAGGGGDEDAGPQIWVIRTAGGEAWKLTTHKTGVQAFEWLPDGSGLVFTAPPPKTDAQKAAEKAGDDAIAVDEGPNGQTRGSYSHLWIVTLSDKSEAQITKADERVGDFAPSPDGRRIAFTYRTENARNEQFRSEVAVVSVATGERHDLTDNEAPESDVHWSPDGALVTFTAPSDRAWELAEDKLWAVPAGGGPERRLSAAAAGAIRSYYWTPDSRSIYFASVWRARGALHRLDVSSGTVHALASGDWMASLDSVTADVTRAASVVSSPAQPGDVHLIRLEDGELTRVTRLNPHIDALQLATCRSVTWKSTDGLEIEGLLWLPSDYAQGALPLLVSVHGGPAGVWTTSFRSINHVYASLGWAVLEPNVRGSSSYGDSLLRGNMHDIGGGDFQDVMTGADAVIAQGVADPDRLGIRGWSYGGILGGWTIAHTDRFKAASLGAMVTDWASEYAMGFNFDVRRWYIGGTPWENPEAYREHSSYSHIAQVRTPTILFHGERDTTDTIGQSMMFYQALKDRGVPTRFLRSPREPHGFREPHHQRIRDAEEITWLMKYVRGIDWMAPAREEEESKGGAVGDRDRS